MSKDPYVLVTGSRTWTDYSAIETALKNLPKDAIIVHGGAQGADTLADHIWKKMGGKTIVCPVSAEEWKKFGRAAGPMRNQKMLASYPISSALAFCVKASKGTMHMISLLNAAKIPVMVNMVM